MNTKTVKEKVKSIKVIDGSPTWIGTLGELDNFESIFKQIDKLYRKEITKEVVSMPIDLGRFGYGDSLVTVVTKTIRQVEEGLKQPKPRMKVLKKMPKEYCSYTCCNIEVSEPKGTEVMCPECKEWVTTK